MRPVGGCGVGQGGKGQGNRQAVCQGQGFPGIKFKADHALPGIPAQGKFVHDRLEPTPFQRHLGIRAQAGGGLWQDEQLEPIGLQQAGARSQIAQHRGRSGGQRGGSGPESDLGQFKGRAKDHRLDRAGVGGQTHQHLGCRAFGGDGGGQQRHFGIFGGRQIGLVAQGDPGKQHVAQGVRLCRRVHEIDARACTLRVAGQHPVGFVDAGNLAQLVRPRTSAGHHFQLEHDCAAARTKAAQDGTHLGQPRDVAGVKMVVGAEIQRRQAQLDRRAKAQTGDRRLPVGFFVVG